jgi:ribonuclease D
MNNQLRYIDRQEDLLALVDELKGASRIAIDLEFDKNHFTYGFNICLLQLFDGQNCYLIDPLSISDFSQLFALFEDPLVELVTFAFGEDYRLLRHLGCAPNNITDLSTVRSLLNKPQSSLTNVLIEELGITSSKDFQRSNWCARPLSEDQKLYAAEDVTFLFSLADKLMKDLGDLNRLTWLSDEKAILENSLGEVPSEIEDTYHKERKEMTWAQWERFKALVEFREQFAQKLNKPTYKVMDRMLLSTYALQNNFSGWMGEKRIHPALRTDKVVRQLENVLEETNKKISQSGISESQPARPSLTHVERVSRSRQKQFIHDQSEQVLIPLKNRITEKYGEHISTFVLSKRMMEKVIIGELRLPNYRLELLKAAAIELGIPDDRISFLLDSKKS